MINRPSASLYRPFYTVTDTRFTGQQPFHKFGKNYISMSIFMLGLLSLFIMLGVGGGLYETVVVYPKWRDDVSPETLLLKLEASGQLTANKKFWPLVSPMLGLLSLINLYLALKYSGVAHNAWLTAALLVLVDRIITFAYFIPTMLRKIMQPHDIPPEQLQRIVAIWTFLSPYRTFVEFAAWLLSMHALILLAK